MITWVENLVEYGKKLLELLCELANSANIDIVLQYQYAKILRIFTYKQ